MIWGSVRKAPASSTPSSRRTLWRLWGRGGLTGGIQYPSIISNICHIQAFWQIPLSSDERRFFCARLSIGGKCQYLAFLRTAQGSRGAPLTWARFAALMMRLTQSLFSDDRCRIQCFVDDPIIVLRGTASERNAYAAMITLT